MTPAPSTQDLMVPPGLQRTRPVVLHVDDDVASLLMAEGALEDAGFDVVHAINGREAIERFADDVPDMIIMDAVMPVMDGFEAIAEIRRSPKGVHVPILMITGLDDLDSITRAYDEGATDFLAKPINFFVLPHRVQYMLRANATAAALRSSEAKLDNAQRIARLGHWEWTLESDVFGFSRGFGRLCPAIAHLDPCLWQDFVAAVDIEERLSLQLAVDRAVAAGTAFHVEFRIDSNEEVAIRTMRLEAEPLLDGMGRCTHMLGTIQDITERRDAQAQIHTLAYFDILTGLPNRAQLHERLGQSLDRARREDAQFAVMFLDLDHFKQVNDTLGHDIGDSLLQVVSSRIGEVLRDSDVVARSDGDRDTHTVARLGGDEFVVLLDPIRRAEDAARVAKRIAAAIREPFLIGSKDVAVSSTIGIAVFPFDGDDVDTLLKHADVAMYHAKESGRDGYQFYSKKIHERSLERLTLEGELKRAIAENELSLVFQPKLSLIDDRVTGCEVLARWQHPTRGEISPIEFIPLAEDTGLILPLGRWVLHAACRQMKLWTDTGLAAFPIAVNCSAVQFTRGDMLNDLREVLESTGLAAGQLEIELTESLLMQDIDAGIQNLEAMQALGVRVSIDDFGTGHSSLSYLKRLPADKLKIDRSFVDDLLTDPGDAAIVAAVVKLSHDLGLSVIAEGVETAAQYAALKLVGCDEAQGYLISRPLVADAFERWLAEHHGDERRAGVA